MTITNHDGKTIISYTLIDGGELDEDGEANGMITDPIYIGVLASATGASYNPDTTNSIGKLASTGMDLVMIAISGGVILLLGVAGLVVARRLRRTN